MAKLKNMLVTPQNVSALAAFPVISLQVHRRPPTVWETQYTRARGG